MGSVERLADLPQQSQRSARIERSFALEQTLQVDSGDVAHRDVQETVGFARVVYGNDARMLDQRREARLAQEALAEALVPGKLGGTGP